MPQVAQTIPKRTVELERREQEVSLALCKVAHRRFSTARRHQSHSFVLELAHPHQLRTCLTYIAYATARKRRLAEEFEIRGNLRCGVGRQFELYSYPVPSGPTNDPGQKAELLAAYRDFLSGLGADVEEELETDALFRRSLTIPLLDPVLQLTLPVILVRVREATR